MAGENGKYRFTGFSAMKAYLKYICPYMKFCWSEDERGGTEEPQQRDFVGMWKHTDNGDIPNEYGEL